VSTQALSDRLAEYASWYDAYLAALIGAPGERAEQVAKYRRVAEDLRSAANYLDRRK
jgi:hypothetical protein